MKERLIRQTYYCSGYEKQEEEVNSASCRAWREWKEKNAERKHGIGVQRGSVLR